jgi:FtsP/CotA-like multicopper oxidase with cupredoxin domain
MPYLRPLLALITAGLVLEGSGPAAGVVQPNANVQRAGTLQRGVLRVTLEAAPARWWADGPHRPPMTVAAFSEPGGPPLMPGPLLRAPAGTELQLSVQNALATPLTFFLTAVDSVVVAPGAAGKLTMRLTAPGDYVYRATTSAGRDRLTHVEGLLAGALVVDSAGRPGRARDRVFVIMETPDSASGAYLDTIEPRRRSLIAAQTAVDREIFTINGRSWPGTERLFATAGDSLHWRVINGSYGVHPMHLHGFYYRVDRFDAPPGPGAGRPAPGQMEVTQLMTPFSGMSMSWSPDRPGNWLFHCHFALHLMPDSLSAAPDDPFRRGMVGLALSVAVAPRAGAPRVPDPPPVRRLRLVAIADTAAPPPGHPDAVSPMRFVIEEGGRRVDTRRAFSPELRLIRGEPVAIMIVNHLPEPTSVHWHGIELQDSYYDGVPGVSGAGARLTPEIAPGDSFEARFTPPRAGTFMYHAHVDEVREQEAGLEGALVVEDSAQGPSSDDYTFFLKGNHLVDPAHPVDINGEVNPDTVVLHVGRLARLRLLNLTRTNPRVEFSLTARTDSAAKLISDTMRVSWVPVAKDGFAFPPSRQVPRALPQVVSIGETYDFEYTPSRPGVLRLEVRSAAGALLIRVPLLVE